MKILRNLIIIGLLLFLVVGAGSYFWLKQYMNSPKFSADITKLTSDKTDGKLVVGKLSPEHLGLSCDAVSLSDTGAIKELRIDGFETFFDQWAVFQKTWKMKAIECDAIHVVIQDEDKKSDKSKSDKKKNSEKKSTAGKSDSEEKDGGFLERFIPTQVEFGKIRVGEFSGIVGEKKDQVSWSEIAMNGQFRENQLDLTLDGGKVQIPLEILPEWNIEKVELKATETDYTIDSASFSRTEGGVANVSGSGDFKGDALSLAMNFRELPVDSLIEKQSKYATIDGVLAGRVIAENQEGDTVVRGQVELTEGKVALPDYLKSLYHYLGSDFGGVLHINEGAADVIHFGEKTIIENLLLTTGSSLSVKGRMELIDDDYVGAYLFGVRPELYNRLPRSLKKKYTEEGEYFWTPVTLSGETEDFSKDLGTKLLKEIGGSLLNDTGLMDKVGDLFDGKAEQFLKDGNAEEAVKKGLDALKGLFK